MTRNGWLFFQWFFQAFWRLFTCFRIPGTTMTPAEFFLFIMFVGLVLKFVIQIVNRSRPVSSSSFSGFIRRNNRSKE